VLLYFIVRVEVVEIQFSFEFKLICNVQNRFEKEFLNWKSDSGQIRRGLAGGAAARWITGVKPTWRSRIRPVKQVRPDRRLTRPEPVIIPVKATV
jgi:hypothetical protein